MLPAREAGGVAGHLARCAGFRQELQALEGAMAVLDHVRPATPPIDLWERLQERLAAQRGSAGAKVPERTVADAPAERRSRPPHRQLFPRRLVLAPLGAAAVLCVALAGYRLGLESAPNSQGVLERSLSLRPPQVADGDGEGPVMAREVARSSTGRIAAIDPPERTLAEWHSWGPLPPNRTRRAPASEGESGLASTKMTPSGNASTNDLVGTAADEQQEARDEGTQVAASTAPLTGSQETAAGGSAAVSGSARERVEATAPAHLADALQASIEEVARRQVTDEIAVLAAALKRGTAPAADAGSTETSGEPR
jgi:hypothetical protein